MVVNQAALFCDSLGVGFVGSINYGNGGPGSYSQLLADWIGSIEGLGPLVSSGIRLASAATRGDWVVLSGAWGATLSSDAWYKSPYGAGVFGIATNNYANGATNIFRFNVTRDIVKPGVGICFYYMDYTSGGDWSWRINGGSWTAMGQALDHDNKIAKFYVAQAVAVGDTIDIRAANSSGTGVGCCPFGIEIFYQTPSSANGFIWHEFGVNGSLLASLVAGLNTSTGLPTGNADCLAVLDQVKLKGGSPMSNTPNLGIFVSHINDLALASKSGYGTSLATFNARCSPLAPIGIISPFENGSYAVGGGNGQSDYRDQAKTSAASFSPAASVLDIYDGWASNGIVGFAPALAQGYFYDGILHESTLAHLDIARRGLPWIRKNFLAAYPGPIGYKMKSILAANSLKATKSTVAYKAERPYSLLERK